MENNPIQDPAGKALSSLQKEYAIIGKHRIKAWHLWLIVGVLAGAVAGIRGVPVIASGALVVEARELRNRRAVLRRSREYRDDRWCSRVVTHGTKKK